MIVLLFAIVIVVAGMGVSTLLFLSAPPKNPDRGKAGTFPRSLP